MLLLLLLYIISTTWATAPPLASSAVHRASSTRSDFAVPSNVAKLDSSAVADGKKQPESSNVEQASSVEVATEQTRADFFTMCKDLTALQGPLAATRDYLIVAVTGCQGSGKSTLLNELFGTTFPVQEGGPGRTTVGAWVDLSVGELVNNSIDQCQRQIRYASC
jgi:ATPase subunit of ABC transporter with duplicated ATPase domains